jgi:PEP-CTERM motif
MKFRQFAFASALSLAALTSAAAQAGVYTVEAVTPFGSWLDTGLDLTPSTTYDFTVIDPATIWSAGSDIPFSRDSTANGINPAFYGVWTMDGFTANYGALVGDAGGTLFLIGTGPTVLKGLSGELTVGYWDSYYPDNSGSQQLSVSIVPEPSTWAMMLLGFAGIAFAARSGARGRKVIL